MQKLNKFCLFAIVFLTTAICCVGQGNDSNETTTTVVPSTTLVPVATTEAPETLTTTGSYYFEGDDCTNETHYYDDEDEECVPKGEDYEYEGSFDATDDPSRNPLIRKMQRLSKLLTKTNSKCDGLIAANLLLNSHLNKTQPKIPQDIDVKLIIISLNGVNDAAQSVSLTARIDFKWIDDRLALPNKTCKGQNLLVRANELWFPYFTSMSPVFV